MSPPLGPANIGRMVETVRISWTFIACFRWSVRLEAASVRAQPIQVLMLSRLTVPAILRMFS